ncbi:MAG: hypothetical protein ACWGQW_04320 [bacterium]
MNYMAHELELDAYLINGEAMFADLLAGDGTVIATLRLNEHNGRVTLRVDTAWSNTELRSIKNLDGNTYIDFTVKGITT